MRRRAICLSPKMSCRRRISRNRWDQLVSRFSQTLHSDAITNILLTNMLHFCLFAGPWATGRVDWSPLSGLTGTRPVVDRYSITRYSTNEWRSRNADILGQQQRNVQQVMRTKSDACNTMARTFALTDQTQKDSTARLETRSADVNKWKSSLERAIAAAADEISTLEEQRVRLKSSMAVLRKPEAIGEFAEMHSPQPK